MKKLLLSLITTTLCIFTATTALAQALPSPTPAAQPALVPSPPNINAKAYVLMDINSGTIIAQKNMNARRAPASLTKLMTLYLTERALAKGIIGLNDKVLISKKAWETGGSRMFVKVNSEVPVDLLTQGIIVDSGNDATMALAQYVGGSISTFVEMMNEEAKAPGMNGTHFMDPTGMPSPDHYSTAYNLALLARAIWLDYPQYRSWYKQKWLTYNHIRQPNRNRLLWRFPGTLGMKTGHTNEAGYCLIAVAERDGMSLLSVVLGTPTDEARADTSIRLLSYGYRFYSSHLLYQAGSVIAKPRIWYGENKTVPAGVLSNVTVTTPRGQFANTQVAIKTTPNLQAPIKKGQRLGTIEITLSGKVIATYPLIALANDPTGGLWRRTSDSIAHKFHEWFGSDSKKNNGYNTTN